MNLNQIEAKFKELKHRERVCFYFIFISDSIINK